MPSNVDCKSPFFEKKIRKTPSQGRTLGAVMGEFTPCIFNQRLVLGVANAPARLPSEDSVFGNLQGLCALPNRHSHSRAHLFQLSAHTLNFVVERIILQEFEQLWVVPPLRRSPPVLPIGNGVFRYRKYAGDFPLQQSLVKPFV